MISLPACVSRYAITANAHRLPLPLCLAFMLMCALFSSAPSVFGVADVAINTSVWKFTYGVTDAQIGNAAWLAADTDGDGITNGTEIATGTNPFKPNSTIKFTSMTRDAEGTHLTFPTVSGKLYTLQSKTSLASGGWANVVPLTQLIGDGIPNTFTVPTVAGAIFYRILVQDADSDNDGVGDWAENMLGFNPQLTVSHGDANDHTTISSALVNENQISIQATNTTATQPADALTPPADVAIITVRRTGTLLFSSVTVPLTISGNAVEGTDYDTLPDFVTFPAKVAAVSFQVTPRANALRRNNAVVSVTAQPGGGYTLVGAGTASVVIYPAAVASGTGLTGNYYVGASSTYTSPVNFGGNTANYSYTRTNTTTGSAVITFSGQATNNRVNLTFSTGNLNEVAFAKIYTINAATGTTFTVPITGTNLPASGTGTCIVNPPVVTRVEPTIDFFYLYGSPNGHSNVNQDNISATWEGYLSPSANNNYTFRIQANDKARVLLDRNDGNGLVQILENGWDTPNTGTFKQGTAINLAVPAAPANRYRIRVEFVETTGIAQCMLQWRAGTGNFGNISSANVFTTNTATTTGWLATYYNNTTFTAPAARTGTETAITATNNGDWGFGSPDPLIFQDNFVARWTGQILPQYSETYYFVGRPDDGMRLMINNQLVFSRWPGGGVGDYTGSIDLKAGVLYDIQLDYYEATGSAEAHLSWYSESQSKQIVPTNRLFPISSQVNPALAGPTSVTSPLTVSALVGAPGGFSFTLTASNGPGTTFSATGLPAWLTLNASTGVLSGNPSAAQAGHYQIVVTATNASGTGSSVLDIDIVDSGSKVTRELWTGLAGSTLGHIPLNTTPTSIDTTLVTLEDATNHPNNTGERLRGYFTAPNSGYYYFWLSANNEAELWISNDAEPINKVRRAVVKAPGTSSRTWNDAAQPGQKSDWLILTGGQKYYYEVLHACPTGSASDHVSVGWLLDPTAVAAPITNGAGVIPGYTLSPFDYPPTIASAGTLYATNMAPQGSAISKGTGSSSLRLNADNTEAIMHLNWDGLTSPKTSYHVHCDAFGSHPSQIIFDIDDADSFHPELRTPDGGYIWQIGPVGTLSAADVIEAIQTGKAYVNVHSVNYPNGEIRGNYGLVVGSQSEPPAVPDPGYTSDHTTDTGAARFLQQAAFGAHPTDVAAVKASGFEAWIDNQFTLQGSPMVPAVLATITSDINARYPGRLLWNAWWRKAVLEPDQLRQKTAFALSQILVISDQGPLNNNARMQADFYDTLLDNSFGTFRDILKAVTLTPGMGIYLDMRANRKTALSTGLHPNENYAREILQLFSVGLNRLWPDGTLMLDSRGNLIPTYTQTEVIGYSRVFTGWNYGQALQANGRLPTNFGPATNYFDPMVLVPSQHELGIKRLLNNVVARPAVGFNIIGTAQAGTEADPAQVAFDTYCLNDLEKALDNIMANSNVGPYICRQLIQRMVTSHPSPGYVARVVAKFNDDGSPNHIVGNMKAVVKAILLDGEARNSTVARSAVAYGKQREPLLRLLGPARTFPAEGATGTYVQGTGTNQHLFTITMPTAHKLSSGSGVFLDFTSNLTQTAPPLPITNPTTGGYTVSGTPASTTTFNVAATGITNATYTQVAGSTTLTVNTGGPTTAVGRKVYLDFVSGTGTDGIYTVASNPNTNSFTVTMGDTTAKSGNVHLNKMGCSYQVTTTSGTTTIVVNANANHNLTVGDVVWFDATTNTTTGVVDGEYTVSSIIDERSYRIVTTFTTAPNNQNQNNNTYYALSAPPTGRSGTVSFNASSFLVDRTDAQGATSWRELGQTPLNAPTVFNFFSPDFKYPGTMANAGLTTPEFQLTTDTSIVNLTNTLTYTLLGTGGGNNTNTSGLASFPNGGGRVSIDLGPYYTTSWTSNNTNLGLLADRMAALLMGGPLKSNARTTIVNFVGNTTNFPYTTPTPTATQIRDRVRAVVHLIITSADYSIQK